MAGRVPRDEGGTRRADGGSWKLTAGSWKLKADGYTIPRMTTMRVLLAEALGTFYLCFAGIAAILCTTTPINAGGGLVAIALAHGIALSIAVSNFGGISGAHLNPAVTAGM